MTGIEFEEIYSNDKKELKSEYTSPIHVGDGDS